jgi:hypothetical protein
MVSASPSSVSLSCNVPLANQLTPRSGQWSRNARGVGRPRLLQREQGRARPARPGVGIVPRRERYRHLDHWRQAPVSVELGYGDTTI